MRTSGSLRSLIHGITTNKSKIADPAYLKEQVNMQTVDDSGLHKRPPLEVVAMDVFPTYVNDASTISYLKSFRLRGVDYILMVQIDATDVSVVTDVRCATYDGTAITLDNDSAAYFSLSTKAEDIVITVQGDRVFVMNKNRIPAMDATLRESENVSLIHVMQAPLSDTSVTVSFTDTADTVFTVTHPVGVAASGRGTDVVAAALRDLINATAAVGVTASARGAVVAITRTDNSFASASVEDDLGGLGCRAINGVITDVTELPRYLTGSQILQVKPEKSSDRGVFYMQSEVDDTSTAPTVPTADWEFTSGDYLYNPDPTRYMTGVENDHGDCPTQNDIGSWQDRSAVAGVKPVWFQFSTNHNGSGIHYLRIIPCPDPGAVGWASGTFGRITVRRKSDLALVYDGAISTADEISWGTGVAINKVISTPVTLTNGDSYYVYINSTVSGGTSLTQVNWIESSSASEPYRLDQNTMPHSITHLDDSTLTINSVDWDEKRAGDEETSPTPHFVGRSISDLAIFQNRLVALVEDEVATSETDNTQSWWRSTVTQSLATHPVRIRSTSEQGGFLTHATFHNKDLILWADNYQYKLAGDIPLTPGTSGMPISSAYVNTPLIKPASIGNRIFFGFTYGNYTGVSQFRADENDAAIDRAEPITDHAKKYISGTPLKIIGDANTGEMYLITVEGTIYVCDYDTQVSREEDTRWAWSKWTDFATTGGWKIRDAIFVGHDIKLLIEKTSDETLSTVFIDTVEDPTAAQKKVYLDFLVKDTVSGSSTITLDTAYPYTSALVVTVDDNTHAEYGNVVDYTHAAGVLTVDPAYNGVNIAYGLPFRASMIPLTQYITDEKGHINTNTRFSILKWYAHLYGSAEVYAKVISDHYTVADQYWSGIVVGTTDSYLDQVADTTAVFSIGYKQRADLADLELYSTSHLPWSLTQLEWLGNYSSRGRRF